MKNWKTLSLIIIIAAAGYADASSVFMGNIETVYPDGLTNALRNPALVSAQTQNNSFGLTAKYTPVYKNNTSIKGDVNFLENEAFNSKNVDYVSGSLFFSFSKKFGDIGFGIGIAMDENDQYLKSEDKMMISGYNPSISTLTQFKSTEKNLSTNPSLSIALGTKAGTSSYTGFKIIGGYSNTSTEKVELSYANSSLTSKKSSAIETVTYSGEMHFGYFIQEKDSQAGLVIKSGTFCLTKSTVDYKDEYPTASSFKNDIPSYKQIRKGPSIVAGSYMKYSNILGIALEGEYRFPSYYNEKGFDDNNNYKEEKMRKVPLPKYWLRGGLEIFLSPLIITTFGGGFLYTGMNGIDKNPDGTTKKKESFEMKGYHGNVGVDIILSPGTKLVLGTILTKIILKGELNSDMMRMELKNNLLILDAFIGISTSF